MVAVLAHALALIQNQRFGGTVDPGQVAVAALYHDATEIITGDMPTPVKYYNSRIKDSYKDIEHQASRTLLSMLPERMQDAYLEIFEKKEEDAYLWKLVKAADKLSAYIKCIEEEQAGNREFISAREMALNHIRSMKLPETELFLEYFIDAYGKNLDELTGGEA